jgi:Collagen triple helix repeat (20 copies)
MASFMRSRLGIPGVIAVAALVFSMAGGAIAANSGSSGGEAAASAKAKKGPRGPKGPKGATGPAGPAGPVGPAGTAGPAGPKGAAGAPGEDGATGPTGPQGLKGATGATGSAGAAGTTGPAGSTGPTGPEGVCSTVTACVLPSGVTETGAWSFGKVTKGQLPAVPFIEPILVPISFSIPLPSELSQSGVHYLDTGEENENCPGTAAEPDADPGHLCIYVNEGSEQIDFESGEGSYFPFEIGKAGGGAPPAGASKTGSVIKVAINSSEEGVGAFAFGTWAVTAP